MPPENNALDFLAAFDAAFSRRRKAICYSTEVRRLDPANGMSGMAFDRRYGTIHLWIDADGSVDCSIVCKQHRRKGLANCHITCRCGDASRLVAAIEETFLPLFEMDRAESSEVSPSVRAGIETAWKGFNLLAIRWP